jgi:hypothetical protein
MTMNRERLNARLETVRMKIRRCRRAVERRTVNGTVQSNNHAKALVEMRKYEAEERHLVALLDGLGEASSSSSR